MGKTKVKEDEHGIYVRGCGYIWRPVFPRGYLTDNVMPGQPYPKVTKFAVGETVTVSHSGGPTCSIKGAAAKERWYSHGSYISNQMNEKGTALVTTPSSDHFKPGYDNWL